ncbi:MAG: discoidin domain-containing protein [Thermodesulfobacteriota bacterium]
MRNTCYFLIILTLGIIIKILSIQILPFDSDQAIVGLMGKHILEGELPWLYYGDSYGGILEPILVSWSFLFFGISRGSLHLIPFIFSILFIVSIFQLGRELYDREIGLLSMLLAAVPFFFFGLYSSLAYGGYIEILWLGNLILLITHRLAFQKETISFIPLFFLGLLWGISWWTYPISIVYLITSFCFLLYCKVELIRKGKILTAASGFVLGSVPFWIWNSMHSFPFLKFSQPRENPVYFLRITNFFYGLIDVFNPTLEEKLSLMAYGIAALFLVSVLFLLIGKKWHRRKFPSGHGHILLFIFFVSFCFFYIGSRFSEYKPLRYFLPLYSLIPFTLALLGWAIKGRSKTLFIGLIVALLIFMSYHQSALLSHLKHNSIRYRKQLQVEHSFFTFLNQKKIAYAYAPEYWSAVELTFNAQENPVFSLPFKNRYPLYTLVADGVSKPAFVLEGKYRQSFEEMFKNIGGTYKKELFAPYQKIKGYLVYYDFKPPALDSLEILPDRWKGKTNINSDSAREGFDRNISSWWTSSSPQQEGVFYQINLGKVYKINRIVLLHGMGREWDFPVQYRIELSSNERDWKEIASAKNNWAYLFWSGGRPFWKLRNGRKENNFNPHNAQFIRITLTGPTPQDWSIGELFVYQAAKQVKSNPVSAEEIISFLSKEKIEYVYADIGLSAEITCLTQGKIKCLQEDYDITQGADYSMWGYNGAFPYFNKLKKQVDFSLSPAFAIAKENTPSFIRTMDRLGMTYSVKDFGDQIVYYDFRISRPVKEIKGGGDLGSFIWTGTHLLRWK